MTLVLCISKLIQCYQNEAMHSQITLRCTEYNGNEFDLHQIEHHIYWTLSILYFIFVTFIWMTLVLCISKSIHCYQIGVINSYVTHTCTEYNGKEFELHHQIEHHISCTLSIMYFTLPAGFYMSDALLCTFISQYLVTWMKSIHSQIPPTCTGLCIMTMSLNYITNLEPYSYCISSSWHGRRVIWMTLCCVYLNQCTVTRMK